MTDLETLIADRLDARADRVPVGPVPLDAVVRQAAVRRRRPFVVAAVAAAVAIVAVGVAVSMPSVPRDTEPPIAPSPSVDRPVGTARVVVDMPPGITAEQGSVRVLVGADRDLSPIPAFRGGIEEVSIDGEPAVRYPAICHDEAERHCTAWVGLPEQETVVVLESWVGVDLAYELGSGIRVLPDPDAAPTQAVGMAHLALDVPASWPTGVSRCTRPGVDSVLRVDRWGTCAGRPLGAGVEVVEPIDVDPRLPSGDLAPFEVEIDGVTAYRSAVVCKTSSIPTCRGWIWVPSDNAGFVVESRTSGAAVAALLDTVSIDGATVTVPGPVPFSGQAFTFGMYRDLAEGLGLSVTIPPGSAHQQWLSGSVRVSPPVGTRVPVGSRVEVFATEQ